MNEIEVNFTSDEVIEHARSRTGHVNSSKTSSGDSSELRTGTIVISDANNSDATVLVFVAKTTDNYLITTTICENSYGQAITHKHFGMSTGGFMKVETMFHSLPVNPQNEIIAKEWLARNPELLLSRVSQVFQASKDVIEDQNVTISKVEEMLVNAHHNMKKSSKKMFSQSWIKWDVMKSLPWFKSLLNKEIEK